MVCIAERPNAEPEVTRWIHRQVMTLVNLTGSLIVVLLWVYYSAQILFFGAEFTQVYANTYGSRVVPSPDAVPLTPEAQAEQGMPRRETVEAAQAREQTDARPAPRGEGAQG